MYKVLLVDDEEVIREGMTKIIDWEAIGFRFMGAAENGIEAYERLMQDPADIVITDLKMPVIDGLELIAKIQEEHPEIVFVVLSGYGEFELAKQAMRYGVKHYLLKPCNEQKIIEVLNEIKDDLLREEAKEQQFIQENREHLAKVLPLVREQFLRDFIANRAYTLSEYEYYSRLLQIGEESLRLVIFQPDGDFGYEELFGLMKGIDQAFDRKRYLTTNIKNQVLVLVEAVDDRELSRLLTQVKEVFNAYHRLEVSIAYSGEGSFADTPQLYQEVWECLQYTFYLGTGSIVTKTDIEPSREHNTSAALLFNFDAVAVAVKSGNITAVEQEITGFFRQLQAKRYEINISKTYALELFMVIIRQSKAEAMESYIGKLSELMTLDYLEQLQEFIQAIALQVTKENYNRIVTTHNKLIKQVIHYIQEHLAEEDLTLKGLASEVFYMNVSYLSKLFLRETGEKFSHYLMRVRMEKAKELIAEHDEELVYAVAQRVGFGNNPQYFSQLFKKYTGYTPSEYKNGLGSNIF